MIYAQSAGVLLFAVTAAKLLSLSAEVRRLRALTTLRPVLIRSRVAVTCPHCGAYVEE